MYYFAIRFFLPSLSVPSSCSTSTLPPRSRFAVTSHLFRGGQLHERGLLLLLLLLRASPWLLFPRTAVPADGTMVGIMRCDSNVASAIKVLLRARRELRETCRLRERHCRDKVNGFIAKEPQGIMTSVYK